MNDNTQTPSTEKFVNSPADLLLATMLVIMLFLITELCIAMPPTL